MYSDSEVRLPEGCAFAKLEVCIFGPEAGKKGKIRFQHYMLQPSLTLGRSMTEVKSVSEQDADLGVGRSNKLSRKHALIAFSPRRRDYEIQCFGKNGLVVTQEGCTTILGPKSPPCLLKNRALIHLGDALVVFLLPTDLSRGRKSDRVFKEFIKAEHTALRGGLMKFGYGRWREIASWAGGRLGERPDEDMVRVARKLVARCYIHARQGVEKKILRDILKEDLPYGLSLDEKENQVEEEIQEAKKLAEQKEKRKYVRWAKKLRLLRRLHEVYHDDSLDLVRQGRLKIPTPPPADWWKNQDDVDLIKGQYTHGYGNTEAMRLDKALGFAGRCGPPLASTSLQVAALKRARREAEEEDGEKGKQRNTATQDSENNEEQDDENEPADEDEDEDNGDHDEGDDDGVDEAKASQLSGEEASDSLNYDGRTSEAKSVAPNAGVLKGEGQLSNNIKAEGKPLVDADEVKQENVSAGVKMEAGRDVKESNGPAEALSDAALLPFPPTDALMRRLRSLINVCAKEYDRRMRERAKKREREEKAKRRQPRSRQVQAKPFSKKEVADFEKTLMTFGVDWRQNSEQVDWNWFLSKAGKSLQSVSHEVLEDAYNDIRHVAQTLVDLGPDPKNRVEDYKEAQKLFKTRGSRFASMSYARAVRIVEALDFFRHLRTEVLPSKHLGQLIRGLKRTKDLPQWWRSAHDRALLRGFDQHGLDSWATLESSKELGFMASMKNFTKKHGDDPKAMKHSSFPDAHAATKRARALVSYFRRRVNDPSVLESLEESANFAPPGSKSKKAANRPSRTTADQDGEDLKPSGDGQHPTGQDAGARDNESLLRSLVARDARRRTILDVPKKDGSPILPCDLGDGLWLLSLGSVRSDLPLFHTDRLIFAEDFASVRQIGDYHFLNEISCLADGPLFTVSLIENFDPDSCEYRLVEAVAAERNATISWLKAANEIPFLGVEDSSSVRLVSGYERFGLYEPTICHYLQLLPGAKECKSYIFRDFSLEGGGAIIEPSVGLLEALRQSIGESCRAESRYKRPRTKHANDVSDAPRAQDEVDGQEMEIPQEWISKYAGKRKRRKSASYWG